LEDLVEGLDGVLLVRREGLVLEDGVVVPVELVEVLQVDEFVELLARLLVHADVGVVIFVEGLQQGGQEIFNAQMLRDPVLRTVPGTGLILGTHVAPALGVHHARLIVQFLLLRLNRTVPFVEDRTLGLAVESEVHFGEVVFVRGLYFLVLVVVLVVVVVEALRGEEVGLRLGER
jgi:hypothetical protein